MSPPDQATLDWVRNASDEAAVANGCRFNAARASYVVWWIERHCRLYEGAEWSGQPLVLHGCLTCRHGVSMPTRWDAGSQKLYLDRAGRHNQCFRAGHALHWQYECLMRLFGWQAWSGQWRKQVRRFKQASIWVAKKNCKSPTLAAVGLYLLIADGESGQKVFLAAKDGTQARDIAGKHAVEMLFQSDGLRKICVLNRSLLQITHVASRSIMRPLSSSNSRTQESKEGLNGSVLIDETHVVDREFVARISRAGISRSEPLQIEVSTAGNNPDGYGKERFDYATDVLEGKREDQELFVAIYAAPQDLSDVDLDEDPLKYGRMANPAMGHTVDPDEYLKDYHRSKTELRKLLDFKMYRLNIWQRSAAPWIRESDWQQCFEKFAEDDLSGMECWAALDLSRKNDLSSLSLLFPLADDTFRLLTYFWLPEDRAREMDHLVPYLTWERHGYLELTPGSVVDFGYIKSRFRELAKKFLIRRLFYDPLYAEELTQSLEQGIQDHTGRVIEEGTGVPREEFAQTIMAFAVPTAEFERFVLARQIRHNGNLLMNWQVGHVQVVSDRNQNIRPVKPKYGDSKKIDGVISAVMAVGGWMKHGKEIAAAPSVTWI